jgi:hypothetical protein
LSPVFAGEAAEISAAFRIGETMSSAAIDVMRGWSGEGQGMAGGE